LDNSKHYLLIEETRHYISINHDHTQKSKCAQAHFFVLRILSTGMAAVAGILRCAKHYGYYYNKLFDDRRWHLSKGTRLIAINDRSLSSFNEGGE